MLRELSTVVVKSGEDLWYAGDTTNLSPQVEKAVNAYVDESHTKQIAVLPLREADPLSDDPNRPKRRENMLGAIVIEQLVDSRPPEGLLQRVDVVRRHSSTALTNAQSHEGLFLLPLWRFIGKSRVLVTARNLPKTILASIVMAAAIAAMWLVPWDFTVTADGKLLPETRAVRVRRARRHRHRRAGRRRPDRSTEGQVVAVQRSLDLEDRDHCSSDGADRQRTAKHTRRGRSCAACSQPRRRPRRRLRRAHQRDRPPRRRGREPRRTSCTILAAEEGASSKSPAPSTARSSPGRCATCIEDRPVRTGTRLMEIADPTQGLGAGNRRARGEDGPRRPPAATELQASRIPNASWKSRSSWRRTRRRSSRGRVTDIDTSAEVAGEEGNTVRMDVAFDQNELLKLLPGATSSRRRAQADPAAAAKAIAELKTEPESRRRRESQNPLRPRAHRLRLVPRAVGVHPVADSVPVLDVGGIARVARDESKRIESRCLGLMLLRRPRSWQLSESILLQRSPDAASADARAGRAARRPAIPTIDRRPIRAVARDDIRISAEVEGVLTQLPVREGDARRRKGQVLAAIDDRQAQAAVEVAEHQPRRGRASAPSDDIEERYAEKAAAVAKVDWQIDLEANAGNAERRRRNRNPQEEARLRARRAANRKGRQGPGARRQRSRREGRPSWRPPRSPWSAARILAPFDGEVQQLIRHEAEWVNPGDPDPAAGAVRRAAGRVLRPLHGLRPRRPAGPPRDGRASRWPATARPTVAGPRRLRQPDRCVEGDGTASTWSAPKSRTNATATSGSSARACRPTMTIHVNQPAVKPRQAVRERSGRISADAERKPTQSGQSAIVALDG